MLVQVLVKDVVGDVVVVVEGLTLSELDVRLAEDEEELGTVVVCEDVRLAEDDDGV